MRNNERGGDNGYSNQDDIDSGWDALEDELFGLEERPLYEKARGHSGIKSALIPIVIAATGVASGFIGARFIGRSNGLGPDKKQAVESTYDVVTESHTEENATQPEVYAYTDAQPEGVMTTYTTVEEIREGQANPGQSFEGNGQVSVQTNGNAGIGSFMTRGDETRTEAAEVQRGIINGYDKPGMWLSEGKPSRYSFANAAEVARVCNNNLREMMKYASRNQVGNLADYVANLPRELQPEGFRGLSIPETEEKLESLSDDEYEAIKKQFDDTMGSAFARIVKVNGRQQNALLRPKNESAPITHDNMELVQCTTDEHDLEVVEFYWLDENGDEIGSMTVKISPVYDADGNITGYTKCMQVINPEGSKEIYTNLEVVEDKPLIEEKIIPPELIIPGPNIEETDPSQPETEETDPSQPETGETTTAEETTTQPETTTARETTTAEETTTARETTTAEETTTAPLETKNKKAEKEHAGNPGKTIAREEEKSESPSGEDYKAIEEQQKADEVAKLKAEEESRKQAKAQSEAAEEAARRAEQQRKEEAIRLVEEAERRVKEEESRASLAAVEASSREAAEALAEIAKAEEQASLAAAQAEADAAASRAAEEAERLRKEEESRAAKTESLAAVEAASREAAEALAEIAKAEEQASLAAAQAEANAAASRAAEEGQNNETAGMEYRSSLDY